MNDSRKLDVSTNDKRAIFVSESVFGMRIGVTNKFKHPRLFINEIKTKGERRRIRKSLVRAGFHEMMLHTLPNNKYIYIHI